MSSNNSKDQRHEEWTGTRQVIPLQGKCAYCLETLHSKCPHEIAWYDKLWICGCDCNKNWKPVNVTAVKKTKETA